MNSESVKNLLPALAAAIAAMPDPKKNAKNDHFKNRYADLGSVLECVFQPLADNGLVMTQTVGAGLMDGAFDTLTTRIWHVASGEFLASTISLRPEKNTPQGVASAITYARRYAIKALFGMVDVDDDGNEASAPRRSQPREEHGLPPLGQPAQPVKRTRMELESCIAEARTTTALRVLIPHLKELPAWERDALRVLWAEKNSLLEAQERDNNDKEKK